MLELGAGFAFVGRQVLLDVGGDEFFIDLLFYHLKLRCYVVIELKGGKFKPEHLGQLGFYLTAVDRQVKSEHDNPTIGLLLCKTKNKVVAEYASRQGEPWGRDTLRSLARRTGPVSEHAHTTGLAGSHTLPTPCDP